MPFDPYAVDPKDCPLLVFSHHAFGWFASAIRLRTKGVYSHVMWMTKPGIVATQGWTYKEVPIKEYMKKGDHLVFIHLANWLPHQRRAVLESIQIKLRYPWYKKMYDVVGVVGQAIGVRWIQAPGLAYCSEDAPNHMVAASKREPPGSQLKVVLDSIPKRMTPDEIYEWTKLYPMYFGQFARWFYQ